MRILRLWLPVIIIQSCLAGLEKTGAIGLNMLISAISMIRILFPIVYANGENVALHIVNMNVYFQWIIGGGRIQ